MPVRVVRWGARGRKTEKKKEKTAASCGTLERERERGDFFPPTRPFADLCFDFFVLHTTRRRAKRFRSKVKVGYVYGGIIKKGWGRGLFHKRSIKKKRVGAAAAQPTQKAHPHTF